MSLQRWVGPLISAQVDGPALTAAATASCIPPGSVYTFPTNFFEIGKVLRVRAAGIISNVITTPGTARYDIRIGGVTAFDSLAMNLNIVAKVNVGWALDVLLTCRAVGAATSTTVIGHGTWTSEAGILSPLPTVGGSATFTLPYNSAPAVSSGWDNTAANALDMRFTQTEATGSMTLQSYVVEALN